MKNFRRYASLLIAVMMVMSTFTVVLADATDFAPITDNFESYTAVEGTDNYTLSSLTEDVTVAGTWVANQKVNGKNFGYDGNAKTAIVANPSGTGNVLVIEARAAYNSPSAFPTVKNTAVTVNGTARYVYKFDMYKEDSSLRAGGGIRFNISGNNYYELYFMGTNNRYTDETKATQIAKCVNGEYTRIPAEEILISSTDANNIMPDLAWFSVELVVEGDVIKWTVTDEDNTVLQTGMYVDTAPFTADSYGIELFAAGQGNTYTYFDNFSVETEDSMFGDVETFDYDTVTINSADSVLAGPWDPLDSILTTRWWGYDNAASAAIMLDPTVEGETANKVLAVEARAGLVTESASGPKMSPSIRNTEITVNRDDKYVYKFDMYKDGNWNNANWYPAGGGIRFNATDNYYYELFIMGEKGYKKADGSAQHVSLAKFVNGTWTQVTSDATIETTINQIDYTPGATWLTVEVTVEQGTIGWTIKNRETGELIQTGSYTDPDPLKIKASSVDLFASGQGATYTYFDNFSVTKYESELPPMKDDIIPDDETYLTQNGEYYIFEDKFGGYTEDEAVWYEENSVNTQSNTLLAKNEAAKWTLSEANCWQGNTGGWIDPENRWIVVNGYNLTNSYLCYNSVINLDLNGKRIDEIKNFNVDAQYITTSRYGVRFAVSEDENTYYEFGRGDWFDYTEDVNPTPDAVATKPMTGYPKRAPYVLKCVNGERTMVEYTDLGANSHLLVNWDISVEGDVITWKATLKTTENDTNPSVWTSSLTDTDGILDGVRYPVQLWASEETKFDNVSLTYKPEADAYVENEDGTIDINIVPERYSRTATNIDVITAFYAQDGSLISADDRTVTAKTAYTLTKPTGTASTEIIVLDGDSDGMVPLDTFKVGEPEPVEEPEPAEEDKIVVTCVGDSLTGNSGKESDKTWSKRLGVLLGNKYVTKNYGVPGRTLLSDGAYPYINEPAYRESLKSEPDIVLIMLGTNDFGRFNNAADDAALAAVTEQFYSDYKALIESYTSLPTNPEVIIATPPIYGSSANQNFSERFVKPIAKRLAADLDMGYLDMYSLVTDYSLLYDGVHFYDEGYFQFAQHFYNAIMKKTDVTITDSEVTINATKTGGTDVVIAAYNKGVLSDVIYKDIYLYSNEPYTIDISDMNKTDADSIKVMFFGEEITPYTYYSEKAVKNAWAENGHVTVQGNGVPETIAAVTVYDASNNLVYAGTAETKLDGSYKTKFKMPASALSGTYTVNIGTAGAGNQTTYTLDY